MSIRGHDGWLLIYLVIVFSVFVFSQASDMILTGQNITDGNTLVSADGGMFTLGFFSPPSTPNLKRYLGIWFSASSAAESICWVANRDRPLNNTSGVLVLTSLGLKLLDGSNNSVWSSGSASTSATGARLLNSGNLVVQGGPDNRKALWQSFDQPCNTLLAGMKIGTGWWSHDEWYLSSWRSANDPGTGIYRYITEPGGGGSTPENVLRDTNGTKKYRTGPWNGERFDGVPEMVSYSSNFTFQVTTSKDGEVTYSYSAKPGAAPSQLRLSEDGVVQRLVWDETNHKWNHFLSEPRDSCDEYAFCGPFGLCDSNAPSSSLCTCFDGFVPVDAKDWSNREYHGGCQRNVSLNCSTDGFHVVSSVKLPDTQDATVDMAASLDDCRVNCLANCSCVAFAGANKTGVSGCITWTNSFADLRLIDGGQDLFIRMPLSIIPGGDKKKSSLAIILESVAGVVALLIIVGTALFVISRLRRWKTSRPPAVVDPSSSSRPDSPVLSIGYQILKQGTNSFAPEKKIGEGGFGIVYKCELSDDEAIRIRLQVGEMVAIKVLKKSDSNMKCYEREVKMMSRIGHINLIRLLACCNDNESAASNVVVLVYEYMKKGSLDFYIFDKAGKKRTELSWEQRLEIITSIAEGVLYLHATCGSIIVHRDLKPANILLANDWTPKIADFGLAKHAPDPKESNTPLGPHGYSAPEFFQGHITVKSDVYSFGVLLLETISGEQNGPMQYVLHHAWNYWNNEGHTLNELLDPAVPIEDEPTLFAKLKRCVQIGLLCVQESPDRRPHIKEVVDMLKTDCPLPRPERHTLREKGQTSNARDTDDTHPLLELTVREEGQTSNGRHTDDTHPPLELAATPSTSQQQ